MMETATLAQPTAMAPLRPWTLGQFINLCVGIIGIQFAWSMQIALSSRVLEPLGADPFLYGLIWCAGPITGLLVQPVVGAISDKSQFRWGRRRPFILLGALLAAVAMLFFPFAPTLWLAALLIWVIDACVNLAQGPYRALVPDNVPAQQHGVANAYLNFAFGAGSVISLGVAPLLNAFHIPMSVEQQYVMAALALVLLIIYTSLSIREMTPPTVTSSQSTVAGEKKSGLLETFQAFLKSGPELHKLCVVQFFTWVGVMCMFIYLTPYMVHHVYQVPDLSAPAFKQLEKQANTLDAYLKEAGRAPIVKNPARQQQIAEALRGVQSAFRTNDSLALEMQRWVGSANSSAPPGLLTFGPGQPRQLLMEVASEQALFATYESVLNALLAEAVPGVDASRGWSRLDVPFSRLAWSDPGVTLLGQLALANPKDEAPPDVHRLFKEGQQLMALQQRVRLKEALLVSVLPPRAKPTNPPEPAQANLDIQLTSGGSGLSGAVAQNPLAAHPRDAQARQMLQDIAQLKRLKAIEREGTNAAQLALVALNLVCLLLSIPLGYLCTRVSKKLVYTLCLACSAVAFAMAPWVTTPQQAIAMMACAGVAWATILSIPFAFLCEVLPPGKEGAMMGVFNMFIAGPQLISATVVGWLISQSPRVTPYGLTHQWSLAFVIAAAFVGLAILMLQTLNERRRDPASDTTTGLPAMAMASGGH
jgi:MFS family permease